jgi:hypothetical protein
MALGQMEERSGQFCISYGMSALGDDIVPICSSLNASEVSAKTSSK